MFGDCSEVVGLVCMFDDLFVIVIEGCECFFCIVFD